MKVSLLSKNTCERLLSVHFVVGAFRVLLSCLCAWCFATVLQSCAHFCVWVLKSRGVRVASWLHVCAFARGKSVCSLACKQFVCCHVF